VAQRHAIPHAVAKMRNVADAEKSTMTGAKSPMKKLFNQFDAVESAAPLLLIDNGNTSLGNTQAIGPIETPYAAVNVYIPLNSC